MNDQELKRQNILTAVELGIIDHQAAKILLGKLYKEKL